MLANQLQQPSQYHNQHHHHDQLTPSLHHQSAMSGGIHPQPPQPPHHHLHHNQRQPSASTPSTAEPTLSSSSSTSSSDTTATLLQSSSSCWDHHVSSMSTDAQTVSAVPRIVSGSALQQTQSQQQECAGCRRPISERYLLRAVDHYWHEDCLKCSCCDCRLGEVGSTLFAKANLLLCRRDYLRLFGATGYCSACSKMIPAFEMVMKAKDNVYHLECFACQQCNHRFCIGDRYYLCDNKILCEFDYDERMSFARLTHGYNVMSQIKRHASSSAATVASTNSGCHSPLPDTSRFI